MKPGADDHDPRRAAVEGAPQGQAVVERAQHVHALELAHARQHAGRGPGGDRQAVEARAVVAVAQLHEPVGEIEAHRRVAAVPLDAEVGRPGRAGPPCSTSHAPESTCLDSGGRS